MLVPQGRIPAGVSDIAEPMVVVFNRGFNRRRVVLRQGLMVGGVVVVATARARVEPRLALARGRIDADHVGATLASEVGEVHVGASRRTLVDLLACLPPELAVVSLDGARAFVVPDPAVAGELVRPYKVGAPVTCTPALAIRLDLII